MEVISKYLEKFISIISKKFLIISALSTSAAYLFYHLFLRKKKNNPPDTTPKIPDRKELNFTKNQIDFMRRKMRFEGLNILKNQNSKLNFKNKKSFKINNSIKKIESQRSNVLKSDQVFFSIINKFSSFIFRNKFAFA